MKPRFLWGILNPELCVGVILFCFEWIKNLNGYIIDEAIGLNQEVGFYRTPKIILLRCRAYRLAPSAPRASSSPSIHIHKLLNSVSSCNWAGASHTDFSPRLLDMFDNNHRCLSCLRLIRMTIECAIQLTSMNYPRSFRFNPGSRQWL